MTSNRVSRGFGRTRGPLGIRLRLLQIGLFLPVLVTGVLGVAYLGALRARQDAVEAAGRQLARRIAESTLALANQRGDSAARAILGPVVTARGATPRELLAIMVAASDSVRRCRCAPLKEGSYSFVWVPATDELALVTAPGVTVDPRPRLRAAGDGVLRLRPGAIWGDGGVDSTGPWLVHGVLTRVASGAPAIAGFDISMASWWSDTFAPAFAAARRQFFAMVPDPDTAAAGFLRARGVELARTGAAFQGPTATIPTPIDRVFELGVALNPRVLPVVLAAAAPPRYPLLIGVMAASVLVSIVALLLLHQVRRTIAHREAFLASISHELRTPLTEVLLHAESLQLDRPTPAAKERAAGAIVRETRRLIGLVENALTIAGAGRMEARARPAAIAGAPVVREALRSLEPAIASRGIRVETALDEAASCAIEPVELDRIVTNLVGNAVRYGPEGQTIRVALIRTDGGTRLEVDDQGPGIPSAERARIWDPFERGRDAGRAAPAGVGLGLAIVRHLAESAGGAVMVGDGPGRGARFAVTLPDQ